jgi:VanZ family protein
LKRSIITFTPGIIWFIVIFILLVMPGSDIPANDFFELIYFDKWVHVGLFALLTLFWAYPFLKSYTPIKVFLWVSFLALLYGVAMEYVQKYFTTTRSFDVTDMLADTTGIVLSILFLLSKYKKIVKK